MDGGELSDKERAWLEHIETCMASQSSMKAYADRHGLDLNAFYLRKKRFKKLGLITGKRNSRSAKLVRVAPSSSCATIIHLSNGISIECRGAFDPAMMSGLLKLAKSL